MLSGVKEIDQIQISGLIRDKVQFHLHNVGGVEVVESEGEMERWEGEREG